MTYDPLDDLRREISQGHVLVVVGSGVSIGVTGGDPLASWKGLLENGVERCVKVRGLKPDWAERVRAEIRSGDMDDLLSAAEKISSKLDFPLGLEYRRWLRETVGTLKAKDRAVLEALRDLNLPLATTNYDGLLEEVTGFPAVTWRDGDKAIRVIKREENGILHLHGYWDEPESVVLGIRSYERILDDKHAQAVLRALQTLKTLLFVGCGEGLADPNFGALLAWAREAFKEAGGRHYRLCRDEELDRLREIHNEDHLHPLSYGAKHSGLAEYLRKLGVFPSGDNEREDDTGPHQSTPRAQRLPAKPRCFGREDEVRDLVEALLQPSPFPTPILGGPGAGKTTITLEALYDQQIVEQYQAKRFFVRCDGAQSREALVGEIIRSLGIEPGLRPEDSLFEVLEREPTVLALDNGETPWEADTTAVEDLLSLLGSVNALGLVVSIRGDQRPLGPTWREAIRVGPLGLAAARDAFLAVAGERFRSDPDLERLLEAVDRLPLAIVLLAHEAEGEPDLAGLWTRWQEKRTALLKRGDSKERLSNIEVSLDLSLNGPRMTPEARRLLSLLSLLPDGIAHGDLDALLPEQGKEAASVLRKVGLAVDQERRLRALAPVREYIRKKLEPLEEDLLRTIDHFLALAKIGRKVWSDGGAEAANRLISEVGNLQEMIQRGLHRKNPEPAITAALDFGWFTTTTGWGSNAALLRALEVSRNTNDAEMQASCLHRLGIIAFYRSDHDTARERYEEALPLYQRVGSVLGEASCIERLGDIAFDRSDSDTACEFYKEALPLYRRAGSSLGEANCFQSLGEIALERSDHATAGKRFKEALSIYRRIGAVLGEANCIQSLGEIALERSDHATAGKRFKEAFSLYSRVGAVLGEANCIQSLGDIALSRSEHDTAGKRYEEALPLYKRISEVRGQANCIQSLGDIALSRSEHDTARTKFTEALGLYKRIQEPFSIGWAHVRLARLAEAESDERQSHIQAARGAWESIKRPDLVEELREEFGEIP